MSERTWQQVLMVGTGRNDLRAEIDGWGAEDPRLVRPGHIGGSMSWDPRSGIPYLAYDCVLRALSDGWRLLGPPVRDAESDFGERWEWTLVREVGPLPGGRPRGV